ncbi:hypothetical protein V8G54_006930 [Vigna mungo]|uniref:Uncharacterized protein n=1 Tax=Vigna mungo TaxID=3915 RepID=A0AAQ3S7U6_VIGMU
MAESVRRTRRRRSYGSESTPAVRGPNIHGWISDEDLHPTYLQRWKERHMLMEQGIQHLLELQGRYYPDLVRVFYYNLKTRDGIAYSKVKQMGIILQGDHYVFAEEVGAPVNEDVDEDDQEAPMQDPTNVAGSSQPPSQYSLESISRQIEMMATMQQTRMDEMMAFHNRRYDEINSHLHEIDSKLAKMYIPDIDDES